jgi:hypothetical protein
MPSVFAQYSTYGDRRILKVTSWGFVRGTSGTELIYRRALREGPETELEALEGLCQMLYAAIAAGDVRGSESAV